MARDIQRVLAAAGFAITIGSIRFIPTMQVLKLLLDDFIVKIIVQITPVAFRLLSSLLKSLFRIHIWGVRTFGGVRTILTNSSAPFFRFLIKSF
jgi:hypothetical protein